MILLGTLIAETFLEDFFVLIAAIIPSTSILKRVWKLN